jgi:hypothetical protein
LEEIVLKGWLVIIMGLVDFFPPCLRVFHGFKWMYVCI